MFKKIVACLSAVFVMLSVFTVSVSAVETSTSSSGAEHGGSSGSFGVKNFTQDNFYKLFGNKYINENGEYKKYADDIFKSDGKVVKDSFGWFHVGGDGQPDFSGIDIFVTDGEFVVENNNPANDSEHYVSVSCRNYTYIGALRLDFESSNKVYKIAYSDVISFPQRYYKNIIYKDLSNLDISKPVTAYQCSDVYKLFLAYLNKTNYNFNVIVPPDGFNKTAIKYYAWDDGPKGKYQLDYYDINLENYAKCGLFADVQTYYSSTFNNDKSINFMHKENITFYVDVTDVLRDIDGFNSAFNYSDSEIESFLNKDNRMSSITDYFNKHFRAVHYEKSNYSWRDFFSDTRHSNTFKFKCYIDDSMHNKVYATFDIKSYYSYLEDVGSSKTGMLTGYRVVHTSSRIDATSGELGKNKDGLGSDISQADDTVSRPPTKQELADMGFENGYQNTEGNFPYTATIYRNGVNYFSMSFSKKPAVTSDYYSDQCIKYGFNVNNMKIYMYFKEQNMSKVFDFTNKENFTGSDYLYWEDDNFPLKPVSETALQILANIMNIDTSDFNNTYKLYMWTNYTGKFPDNYNGFYVKFNWNLEDGNFQRNNSDDDYDYSQDFVKESPRKDNNGNIQGGGDDGAALIPTEAPSQGLNNTNFSFDDNTLWGYSNQFLVFCARCFTVLPGWIWLLIASGIAIIIVLRILGR